jgi:hypothetical protein
MQQLGGAACSSARSSRAGVRTAAATATALRSTQRRRQLQQQQFVWEPLQHSRLPLELQLLQQQQELSHQWLAQEQEQQHQHNEQHSPLPPTPTPASPQDAARLLTSAISRTQGVPQLLALLGEQQDALDAIHLSAAVKRACRQLRLDLQLPQHLCSSPDGQQQQQQHVQQAAAQWLQQLQGTCGTDVPQQEQLSQDWQLVLLLAQLCQQHAPSMGSQQLVTCASGLAHLAQAHAGRLPLLLVPPLREALQRLLQAAQLHTCDPRGLSLLLHAAAVAAGAAGGFEPQPAFLRAWYRASRASLARFSCLDLAMSVGALGRMQLFPPAEWMQDFWPASKVGGLLRLAGCAERTCAEGPAWKARLYGQEPSSQSNPPRAAHTLLPLLQAALPACSTEELLHLLLGMAGTRRQLPEGWLQPAAGQLQARLGGMSPSQLSTSMLAIAKLNYTPSPAWMAAFWAAWEGQQAGFSTKGHATILWGVGTIKPGGGSSSSDSSSQQAEFARRVQAALQHAVARTAKAVAAVALQKLKQAALQQQLAGQQPAAAPQEQQQPAQLHAPAQQQPQQQQPQPQPQPQQQQLPQQQQQQPLPPPGRASGEEQPQLLSSASLLHPTDCAMMLYGLARLGPACVDPSFPGFWLAQAHTQQANMNSQELSICLWGLGKLQLQPPEAWLAQHMACTARLARCMSHRQLAMVLWSCARLRVRAIAADVGLLCVGCWLTQPVAATDIAAAAPCLPFPQYLPNVGVTAELLMAAAQELPRFSPHSLSLLLWSLGSLGMQPNKEWMQLLLDQAWSTLK